MSKDNKVDMFCKISGASSDILAECSQSERIKYSMYGVFIVLTTIFAVFSSTFFIYSATQSIYIALIFGFLWGVFILNLDRYLISTFPIHKKGKLYYYNKWIAVPRVVLAIMLSLFISIPLEMYLFRVEIKEHLDVVLSKQSGLRLQARLNQPKKIIKEQEEYLKEINTSIDNSCAHIQKKVDKDMIQIQEVSEGITKTIELKYPFSGCGSTCSGLKKREKEINAMIIDNNTKLKRCQKDEKTKYSAEIDKINSRINDQKIKIDGIRKEIEEDITKQKSNPTALTSYKTLHDLMDTDNDIFIAVWFISLLFIVIEIIPVVAKAFTQPGEYDFRVYQLKNEAKQLITISDKVNLEQNIIMQRNFEQIQKSLDKSNDIILQTHSVMAHDISKNLEKAWSSQLAEFSKEASKYALDSEVKIFLDNLKSTVGGFSFTNESVKLKVTSNESSYWSFFTGYGSKVKTFLDNGKSVIESVVVITEAITKFVLLVFSIASIPTVLSLFISVRKIIPIITIFIVLFIFLITSYFAYKKEKQSIVRNSSKGI